MLGNLLKFYHDHFHMIHKIQELTTFHSVWQASTSSWLHLLIKFSRRIVFRSNYEL